MGIATYGAGYQPAIALANGGVGGRTFRIASYGGNPGFFVIRDDTSATDRLVIDSVGRVGIGVTSPQGGLEVGNWILSSGSAAGYAFRERTGSVVDWMWYANDNKVRLYRGVAAGASEPFTIDKDGNVTISGNINAKYQDIAEWVPSQHDLAPGTVVVLDATRNNSVRTSTSSYDTSVAGVISGQPGILLGEEGIGKEAVATTGRVKVRVDATSGFIRIGDLLVTSNVEGHAMRSQPIELTGRAIHQPGTIIGKALEPLENGRGEILVLLTLQ